MKKPLLFLILTFTTPCALSLVSCLWASGPNTISYQGRLRESGQPVSGIRGIQFRLFDAASAGAPVFDSGSQNIYVSSGIFSYQLGGQGFKDLSWATSSYWLEISVGGNAMSPREQINAMPYAFMSSTAASLNGSGNIQITGAGPHYILNNNVGIGINTPSAILHVSSNTAESAQDFFKISTGVVSGSDVFVVKGSGKVGIGTTNPGTKLDVEGTIESKIKGGLWEGLSRNMSYSPYILGRDWLISASGQQFLDTNYISLSNSNTRFTLNKAGWYRVNIVMLWENTTANTVYRLQILLNGGLKHHLHWISTSQSHIDVNNTIYVYSDGNDYIELESACDTSQDFQVYGQEHYNQLMIEYVGRQ